MDIGNESIACQTGDFVMILPNVVHSFYMTTAEQCTFMHIHFNPEFFRQIYIKNTAGMNMCILDVLNISCNFYYHTKQDEKIHILTEKMIHEFQNDTIFAKIYSNLYLSNLLIYVAESLSTLGQTRKENLNQNTYVSFALQYIQDNCTRKILIPEIAEQLHISPRYLSKIFFEQMNMTLVTCINTFKINQSIDYMIHTDMSMNDIAAAIGLKHAQHFSKLFYNVMGITPHKYKEMLKNLNM